MVSIFQRTSCPCWLLKQGLHHAACCVADYSAYCSEDGTRYQIAQVEGYYHCEEAAAEDAHPAGYFVCYHGLSFFIGWIPDPEKGKEQAYGPAPVPVIMGLYASTLTMAAASAALLFR